MIGGKRSRRRSTVDRLEYRGFDLQEAPLVQKSTQCRNQPCADLEYLTHIWVDGKVYVALAVALLLVSKGVEYLSILLLDHWQRAQGFGQEAQRLSPHGRLSCTGDEHRSAGFDKVSQIQILPEHRIDLIAQKIATQVELEATAAILNVHKRRFAHHPDANQAANDRHYHWLICLGRVLEGCDGLRRRMGSVGSCWIGLYACFAQARQLEPTLLFLVSQPFFGHKGLLRRFAFFAGSGWSGVWSQPLFDAKELHLDLAPRSFEGYLLASLATDKRLTQRGLIGDAAVARVGFSRADDGIGLWVKAFFDNCDLRAEDDGVAGTIRLDQDGVLEHRFDGHDPSFEKRLLPLGLFVACILRYVAVHFGIMDGLSYLRPTYGFEMSEFLFEFAVTLRGQKRLLIGHCFASSSILHLARAYYPRPGAHRVT